MLLIRYGAWESIMKFGRLILLISTAVLASACATKPYAPVQFTSKQSVKSIALADDVVKDKLDANTVDTNMGLGYQAGGPIGLFLVTAFETGETISRKDALADIMDATDFDAENEFQTLLREKLEKAGFTNAPVVGKKRKYRELHLKTPKSDVADAVLDISITNFGVQKSDIGEDWKPAAAVEVRLVSSKDKSILMENKISYNKGFVNEANLPVLKIAARKEGVGYYKIKDIDGALMAGEMRTMLDKITDVIVLLLN